MEEGRLGELRPTLATGFNISFCAMNTVEFLIEKVIKLYETNTGWGDSGDWSNQDFIILSERIQQRTGVALSHVTLKRVWGKVKYDSLPSTHTLNTLVQYLGYECWRDFRSQNSSGVASAVTIKQINGNGYDHSVDKEMPEPKRKTWVLKVFGMLQAVWF